MMPMFCGLAVEVARGVGLGDPQLFPVLQDRGLALVGDRDRGEALLDVVNGDVERRHDVVALLCWASVVMPAVPSRAP